MPPRIRIMDFGGVVSYCAGLARTGTGLKNKIDAHLLMHGVKIEGTRFTKAYMAKLRADTLTS